MINSRKDIRDYILQLEKNHPVNDWVIEGFHIWPILRIRLFFYLIKKIEYSQKTIGKSKARVRKSIFNKLKLKIQGLFSIYEYVVWKNSLPKKNYMFLAQDAHRVNFGDTRFNRFFDVMIGDYGIQKDSIYFETISNAKPDLHYSKAVYDYAKALNGYLKLKKIRGKAYKNFNIESYNHFINELSQNELTKDFVKFYTNKKIARWYSNSVTPKIEFFEELLKKVSPKQIAVLCYYSENNMLLLTAANRMNIKTIEMQHGPQSDLHLCYSNWNHIPKGGYDILPRNYWCWDKYTTDVFSKWVENTDLYAVFHVGNPWVNFWKARDDQYAFKEYILYCLQPDPVTLDTLFSNSVVNLIKTSGYTWFIRLHPRQLHRKTEIKKLLDEKGLLDLVNIDDATNDPLPQLLVNAKIHVTHFSGSTIEAALMNTKTVLLNEIGIQSFPEFIASGEAIYLNPDANDFADTFKSALENTQQNDAIKTSDSSVKDLF